MHVLVTGPPGAGKSTLAEPLALELGLPLLAKDRVKQVLVDALGAGTVAESRRLGAVAVQVLLAVAADARGGVLDSVWVDRASAVEALERLAGPVVEVHLRRDRALLEQRYAARAAARSDDLGRFDTERSGEELWADHLLAPVAGSWPVVEVAEPDPDPGAVADAVRAAVAPDRVTLSLAVDEAGSRELWSVHDAVLGDATDESRWRETVWGPLLKRAGSRLARAYVHDRLVGFAYGCTGRRGHRWTDTVAARLGEAAEDWLDGHGELVCLGVLPEARGLGLGRRLHDVLTGGGTHDRWLVMTTADAADPARRLYASAGWRVVGPAVRDDQVVLGLRPRG